MSELKCYMCNYTAPSNYDQEGKFFCSDDCFRESIGQYEPNNLWE